MGRSSSRNSAAVKRTREKGKRTCDSACVATRCELEPRRASPCVNAVALGACRGFILLRTGFFGGGITSAVPPLAVIFSAADFEKWCALTVSFLVSSPLPRMRTPSAGPLARPTLLERLGIDGGAVVEGLVEVADVDDVDTSCPRWRG